ncbi:hypothetical protein WEH80_20070 [Actinomycetes bacterium KLBMP 9759]
MIVVARARWRAAEDRLYPTLLTDAGAYRRGIAAVQAVLCELRRRGAGPDELVELEAAPNDLLAAACPQGVPIPVDLLVAVACGMRDRELAADASSRRREEALRVAMRDGAAWAVLEGPSDPAELSEGRRVVQHVDTGTVIEATVDPWARDEPYGLLVVPGGARTFTDRATWLAALHEAQDA